MPRTLLASDLPDTASSASGVSGTAPDRVLVRLHSGGIFLLPAVACICPSRSASLCHYTTDKPFCRALAARRKQCRDPLVCVAVRICELKRHYHADMSHTVSGLPPRSRAAAGTHPVDLATFASCGSPISFFLSARLAHRLLAGFPLFVALTTATCGNSIFVAAHLTSPLLVR